MTERRIYYEDTDAGGVVYYANYLRYLEQGRTEFLRARGLSVRVLHEQGYLIPVMRLEIDYLVPAVLDDLIRVDTTVQEITGSTCTLDQQVVRVSDGEMLVDANRAGSGQLLECGKAVQKAIATSSCVRFPERCSHPF